MNQHLQDTAKRFLRTEFEQLQALEQRVIRHIAEGTHISRHTAREFEEQLTFGQRLADGMATFGGMIAALQAPVIMRIAWPVGKLGGDHCPG